MASRSPLGRKLVGLMLMGCSYGFASAVRFAMPPRLTAPKNPAADDVVCSRALNVPKYGTVGAPVALTVVHVAMTVTVGVTAFFALKNAVCVAFWLAAVAMLDG